MNKKYLDTYPMAKEIFREVNYYSGIILGLVKSFIDFKIIFRLLIYRAPDE